MIQGIFTPNLIPFRADGAIHETELRRMIHWLIDKGVGGLYPNGSTGEFIRLNFEERKRVIRIIAEENRGRVPILAGAAEANINEILEAAALYAELGCVAISLTGPYYFKVSQESVEEYFREIARRSPIDILLYNIPQFANEISLPVVERLARDCPRIVGIKDSSRDFPRLVATLHKLKAIRPEFTVLTGTEEILLPSLLMGADGGTIATSGVVPEVVMKLYREFKAGNLAEAKRIQFKLLDLIEAMFAGPIFPEGFRAAASLRGFEMGHSRQPISSKEKADLSGLRGHIACILAECGFGEAAGACIRPLAAAATGGHGRVDVDRIVRDVMARVARPGA
ncbi:MAG: dihydrodipicolinate synthase family protein [Verrucomicrobia bacterium]|jgi:4-hydroxy-tetrahydrodipicolinate synthase|nr:dihydrodipicolinate synthase family protein [Verrucomicrobiota bacterium]